MPEYLFGINLTLKVAGKREPSPAEVMDAFRRLLGVEVIDDVFLSQHKFGGENWECVALRGEAERR